MACSSLQRWTPNQSKTMKSLHHCIILMPFLIWCNGCHHPKTLLGIRSKSEITMKTNAAHNWNEKTFVITDEVTGNKSEAKGWSLRIGNISRPPSAEGVWEYYLTIDAFVVPSSKAIWVGIPHHIYLLKHDKITGVRLNPLLGISFIPSIFDKAKGRNDQLDKLKTYIEGEVDFQMVARHLSGYDYRGSATNKIQSLIVFRKIFQKHLLFHPQDDSFVMNNNDWPIVVSYQIVGGTLTVDMTSFGGKEKGTAWIRIADKTLLRAVENGVQVFPVETKQPAP